MLREFKDILRDLRTERGISQRELGRQIGIAYSTIARYEKGVNKPEYHNMKKLSEFFGVSMSSMLSLDGIDFIPSMLLERIEDKYRELKINNGDEKVIRTLQYCLGYRNSIEEWYIKSFPFLFEIDNKVT